ncbi:lmo0937 family membrane protein [Novosphingobium sp. YJ-S2-02]|uniref:Lmo0937 family membrane protein n=1 Tax=Novosphingobium aureum TaxID=2792964 RepID=A0A931MMC6_9SPHN|nr:lmo0937 family membrane protein [Novosphingobium aureum]MBH0114309.1 lmo0937 family membrane protein [Novosphingobium aureum]
MLMTIVGILIVLWLLGFLVFKVTGALIHILLVLAVIVGLVQLFRGKRGL